MADNLKAENPLQTFDAKFDFVLSEPVECHRVVESNFIRLNLRVAEYNPSLSLLQGFSIMLVGSDETGLNESANRLAKKLTDYLSLKSNKFYEAKMTGFTKYTKDGFEVTYGSPTITSSIRASVDLDMQDDGLQHLLWSDDDIVQQTHHVSLALRAEELDQYELMFKEYFQVIEKQTDLQDYAKYKALRHALSHQLPLKWAKEQVEKHFGPSYFRFTYIDEFDHNSPTNIQKVREQAKNLKGIAMQNLKSRLPQGP